MSYKHVILATIAVIVVIGLQLVNVDKVLEGINTIKVDENKICKGCNIVLISIDTLRADHVGLLGYERNTTPNIDLLSNNGYYFPNAYSTSSWTLPAHVSL
ncbi:MAG: sulfatase-like hydrolase/transferase, partial [Candidatus Altiarchaeota archaeon]|nr:sulfatase-like hydrolase/transferase [Candidatus Altiarchaeota archaeon]